MAMRSKIDRKTAIEEKMKKLSEEMKAIAAAEREERKKEHEKLLKDLGKIVYSAGLLTPESTTALLTAAKGDSKLKGHFGTAHEGTKD